MSEDDEAIRRAAALPPPSIGEAVSFHVVRVLERKLPGFLDLMCESARDKTTVANVIALHGKTGDRDWETPFEGAEIRIESAASMIRAETAAAVPPANK